MTGRLMFACALLVAIPAAAFGQANRPAPRPPSVPSVEVGVGFGFAGGFSLGDRDAVLRTNGASAFTLFSTETTLDPAPVLDIRLGYRLSARLVVEGLLSVGRPSLTSSLSADAEGAAAVDATTSVTEYVITGGGVWKLSTNPRRRWTPFVSGGGGVARHVYDGRTLVENGVTGYAGGGILYPLGRRAGLRLDGRAYFLSGGIAEGQGVTPRAALSGSIFVAF